MQPNYYALNDEERQGIRDWLQEPVILRNCSCPFAEVDSPCCEDICYRLFPLIHDKRCHGMGILFCPCEKYSTEQVTGVAKSILVKGYIDFETVSYTHLTLPTN